MKLSLCGLACFLAAGSSTASPKMGIGRVIEQVKANMPELNLQEVRTPSMQETEYFRHYGLMPPGAMHFFGTFRSGGNPLAAHVYRPPESRGSVILVHGYYDHAGIWKHLLSHLVGRHLTVAILELPGHGLSSGERVSVGSFSEYLSAVHDFICLCRKHLNGPFHIVAHSMGAGVAADYLLSCDKETIDGEVVFLAPLIRSAHHRVSGLGRAMASPFCSSLPRWFRKNSSDEAFLRFVKTDPLQERRLPLAFCRAMHAWSKDMAGRQPIERKVMIIQGTGDSTVDWRYNLAFLKEKIPNADIEFVPEAGHQLANESVLLRQKAFRLIDGYIQDGSR